MRDLIFSLILLSTIQSAHASVFGKSLLCKDASGNPMGITFDRRDFATVYFPDLSRSTVIGSNEPYELSVDDILLGEDSFYDYKIKINRNSLKLENKFKFSLYKNDAQCEVLVKDKALDNILLDYIAVAEKNWGRNI